MSTALFSTASARPTAAPTSETRLVDGPTVGLAGQLGLLAGLAVTVGLGPGGWLAGTVTGAATWALLRRGLRRSGAARLGPANAVTLTRAVLVGGVTALAVDSLTRAAPVGVILALTVLALVLDAVDGPVARRTGTQSALGARFDMEVDAFLILVLSLLLVRPVGGWVLVIGGMRYAFAAAGGLLPWLTAVLPPRFSRKVVAAVQGVVLITAVSGVLPDLLTTVLLAVATAALTWSFGRDLCWLGRLRHAWL
jgi:phosphatidylglycerophosphate synthase